MKACSDSQVGEPAFHLFIESSLRDEKTQSHAAPDHGLILREGLFPTNQHPQKAESSLCLLLGK